MLCLFRFFSQSILRVHALSAVKCVLNRPTENSKKTKQKNTDFYLKINFLRNTKY